MCIIVISMKQRIHYTLYVMVNIMVHVPKCPRQSSIKRSRAHMATRDSRCSYYLPHPTIHHYRVCCISFLVPFMCMDLMPMDGINSPTSLCEPFLSNLFYIILGVGLFLPNERHCCCDVCRVSYSYSHTIRIVLNE
jgi:hypothetical protein